MGRTGLLRVPRRRWVLWVGGEGAQSVLEQARGALDVGGNRGLDVFGCMCGGEVPADAAELDLPKPDEGGRGDPRLGISGGQPGPLSQDASCGVGLPPSVGVGCTAALHGLRERHRLPARYCQEVLVERTGGVGGVHAVLEC